MHINPQLTLNSSKTLYSYRLVITKHKMCKLIHIWKKHSSKNLCDHILKYSIDKLIIKGHIFSLLNTSNLLETRKLGFLRRELEKIYWDKLRLLFLIN